MTRITSFLPKNLKIKIAGYYLIPKRAKTALNYYRKPLRQIPFWLWHSHEVANFTYGLTKRNKLYLAHFIALITEKSREEIEGFFDEIESNNVLINKITKKVLQSDLRYMADMEINFGRRIGWYAFARALKPKVIVETGVDKGLGACVLTAALLKNAKEGYPGQYFGTDIVPEAGYFLDEPYQQFGQILYGDSIKSLGKFNKKIDLFINDSDHSARYEQQEYLTVKNKLSKKAVMIGDNSHVTEELAKFAKITNRKFLFFREEPADHWYPGAGLGVAFN